MNEAYPLQWPAGKPRTSIPARSRFDVTFATARDELVREIQMLGGNLPVLSTNIPLKRDGLPYAGEQEPDDRGTRRLLHPQEAADVLRLRPLG